MLTYIYHNCIGRFELFLDLLYVAILSNFADALAEDISGAKLVKYIVSSSSRKKISSCESNSAFIASLGSIMACMERHSRVNEFVL